MDFILNKISKGRSQSNVQPNSTQSKSEFEKEWARYERLGEMSPCLQKLYDAIKSIAVSSVESERVFSVGGSYVTKVRTRLEDQTVDDLVFLRKYYSQNAN